MGAETKQFSAYSDIEIIQQIIAGEVKLYEILIRRLNPVLFKTGRAYGFNHADTQDLMQETYVAAFYNLAKFENRSAFKTWVISIMLRQCFHKKQKLSFKNEQPVEAPQNELTVPMFQNNNSNAENLLVNKELGHVLENALGKIPEDYRMVFTLRELNGLSVIETADALTITESNVKVRLNRAKKLLRSEIEKMYSPDEIFEFNLVYCDAIVERVMKQLADSNYMSPIVA